jgi:glycosyltransferase involved in cell wall biosynthesis
MVRALVNSARLVAVHGEGARRDLLEALRVPENSGTDVPDFPMVSIRMGEGVALTPEETRAARSRVRETLGIAEDAVVFGCFGGLTPEKRIPQILAAFAALEPHARSARLLLAGAPSAHYDVAADIAAHGLGDRVILRGYLETDAELTDTLAACDVSLNLRWPTARETSGPWLRALAAGRPTVIMDLAHLGNVPSLDPRTWTVNRLSASGPKPICIASDVLDEDHSLRLAMRRLAADADLRSALGQAARAWWAHEHSVDAMVEDYTRVIADAAGRPDPRPSLPAHMRDDADGTLRALLAPFGIEKVW